MLETFAAPLSILQQLPQVEFSITPGSSVIDGIGILTVQAAIGDPENGRFTASLAAQVAIR